MQLLNCKTTKNYEKNKRHHEATQIAKEHEAIYKSDYICGDVLICNDDEVR